MVKTTRGRYFCKTQYMLLISSILYNHQCCRMTASSHIIQIGDTMCDGFIINLYDHMPSLAKPLLSIWVLYQCMHKTLAFTAQSEFRKWQELGLWAAGFLVINTVRQEMTLAPGVHLPIPTKFSAQISLKRVLVTGPLFDIDLSKLGQFYLLWTGHEPQLWDSITSTYFLDPGSVPGTALLDGSYICICSTRALHLFTVALA